MKNACMNACSGEKESANHQPESRAVPYLMPTQAFLFCRWGFAQRWIHSIRQQELDGMRIAQREGGDLPLDVGAVTDANNVQFPGEPGGDALHRIGGQRAG